MTTKPIGNSETKKVLDWQEEWGKRMTFAKRVGTAKDSKSLVDTVLTNNLDRMKSIIVGLRNGMNSLPESVIYEGRDAPLYHTTNLVALLNILKENTIGTGGEVSLTRDKNFRIRGEKESPIVIELDQAKLITKYKLRPYAYAFAIDNSGDELRQSRDEAEEMVKGKITDADRYITKIYINDKTYEEIQSTIQRWNKELEYFKNEEFEKFPHLYHNPDLIRKYLREGNPRTIKSIEASKQYTQKLIKEYQDLLNNPKVVRGKP